MRLLLILCCLLAPVAAIADSLLIAAGAGYKKPLTEVYAAFTQDSGIQVQAAFGNMRQVIAQTRDSDRVDLVVGEQGLLTETGLFTRFTPLGRGRLVLAYAHTRLSGYQTLADTEVERIALPDPKKAIYGRAATQFLERSGLMPQVREKLMTVATVPQVSAYLIAGTVDAGFINITDALGIQDKIAGFEELPSALYDPPIIALAYPTARPASEAATAFAEFLGTQKAKAIFAKYGL
ncbi:molybdate ABC transporter substrate-binding protein [Thiocystis violacea]|uniref:molybdate ABC transporter substrate-binding protein n=1 Tax=Thiocystis violacea TaxID=13725 RepID=UPI0019081703|nr:molybdate ABC transporter substrate-binding protein [Thiocystis violacea]MBK1722030.1 molybdate ABC transporter substrate-binding protein [Thiocystis violacea]